MKIADFMDGKDVTHSLEGATQSSTGYSNGSDQLHISVHCNDTPLLESLSDLIHQAPKIAKILKDEILADSDPDDYTPLQSTVSEILNDIGGM